MTDRVVTIEPTFDGGVVVTIRGCRVALVIPWWSVATYPNRYVIAEDE